MKKNDNLLNEEQIHEWKEKYKRIWKTTVGENTIIWRKLSRADYKEIMTDKDILDKDTKIFDRQDQIVEKVALYPDNIVELIEENGGLASTVADRILDESGFNLDQTEEL
jgi:hypothetical protein